MELVLGIVDIQLSALRSAVVEVVECDDRDWLAQLISLFEQLSSGGHELRINDDHVGLAKARLHDTAMSADDDLELFCERVIQFSR